MPKAPAPVVAVEPAEVATPGVTIVLNDANREKLANCKEGESKWILVNIASHDETMITGEVEEVDYSEDAAEEVVQDETGEVEPEAISKIRKGEY